MSDRQMDAPLTDRNSSSSSSGHSSSFAEERRARVNARARGASLAVSEADEMPDYSMISVSPLGSPDWSMTSSHLQQSLQSQPASLLFSDQYPSLVTPLNQDPGSMYVGGGDTPVSISESLRPPAPFGAPDDWARQSAEWGRQSLLQELQRTRSQRQSEQQVHHVQPMQPIDLSRYSIEFPAHPPPMSFPVTAALAVREAATRPRPPARIAYDATALQQMQQPRSVPSLMQLQPGVIYGGQAMNSTFEGVVPRREQWPDRQQDTRHFAHFPAHLRTQWQREQNEQPARRARPSSNCSRRNSGSDSSAGSSRGSSGNRTLAVDCSYCRSVGGDPTGHNKHNCPRLMMLPACRICGASGRDNHTESHCPDLAKTELEFIPKQFRPRFNTI